MTKDQKKDEYSDYRNKINSKFIWPKDNMLTNQVWIKTMMLNQIDIFENVLISSNWSENMKT